MNIAYFIASPIWGGGEQYVYDLALHVKEKGGIRLFFLFPPHSNQAMISRFTRLGECRVFPYVSKGVRFLPFSGRQLAKLLDLWQIDILHINSRQSYFAAAWAKRFAAHPFRLIATQHLVRPAKNSALWRWAYRKIDLLIFVSDCVRRQYMAKLKDKDLFSKIAVVYNSTAINGYEINSSPRRLNHILFHGRICREKGIEPLFKALAMLSDLPFQMTFCGNISPRDKDMWDKLMSTSPVRNRIRHLGFQSDMRPLLSEHGIGILPSIVAEAGPLSIFEDMSFALAIVTTNNGSQPEVIQNGVNGLLCSPDNPTELAAALRRLLTDPTLTQTLGERARTDFQARYSYDRFIETMYHYYTR